MYTYMLFNTPELGERELKVIGDIDEIGEKLRLRLHEPHRWTGSLRRAQFARAIQGSNSIEGFEAAVDDAAAIELGEEPLDANKETRLAIQGLLRRHDLRPCKCPPSPTSTSANSF